ncbi:hypothetical protein EMIHUDRAFT_120931, partial [Emiliania huxleyi CCMP1516]|uniref:Tubulin/FtsZ GTPase domain-containing protein n=2 Tax=Emiliania huxleyi TaxID=2903 RepID=A0A0D3IAJ6_EMIH1
MLYLHVGQAGNEVGSAFWRLAASEGPPAGRVFDEKGRCRAVFVDTEPKACDGCPGVMLAHSLGGGTGSGLGSRLVQELRDEHPRAYLLASSIAPFGAGELPLAAYNGTLALATLQEHSDAVLLFDNASLMSRLRDTAAAAAAAAGPRAAAALSSGSSGRLCLRQIDDHVAACLCGLALPADYGGAARPQPFLPGQLVAAVAPLARYKLLELSTARGPQAAPPPSAAPPPPATAASPHLPPPPPPPRGARRPVNWSTLGDELAEQLPRFDLQQRPALALARGAGNEAVTDRDRSRLCKQLGPSAGAGTACGQTVEWWEGTSAACALPGTGAPRTLTLAANRTAGAAHVGQLALRAELMLLRRAYAHHYDEYGVGLEEMQQA